MSIFSTTLRPGLLVNVKTSVRGNVSYRKFNEVGATAENGAIQTTWETERTVIDQKEQEAASKVRSSARSLIASVCANSAFGLLCPEANRADLDKAVAEARKLCDEFNRTSSVTFVKFFAIAGRIAPDDVEAVKAINSEVRDLLSDMRDGLNELDVKAVRAAADRAKQLGSMLSPDAQVRLQFAIDAVRDTAKRMVKAGETAATEIDAAVMNKLAEARTAFLDLDPAKDVIAPVDTSARAIDLTPHVEVAAPAEGKARELELG